MYCTFDDIQNNIEDGILGELSNSSPDNVANVARVELKITDASAVIDATISSRYVLPLKNTHAILRMIAVQLAKAYLYQARNNTQEDERAKQALEMLQQVKSGELILEGETKKMTFKITQRC